MDDRTIRRPPDHDDPEATGPLWPLPGDDQDSGERPDDDLTASTMRDDDESTSVISPHAAAAAGFETRYAAEPTRVAPDGRRDWLEEPLPQAPPPRARAGRPRPARRSGPAWPRLAAPIALLVAVLCVFTFTVRSGVLHHGQPTVAKHAATHATTSPKARSKYRIYVVKSGDTMSAIALKYHTTVNELLQLNPRASATTMNPGDKLRVPPQ